MKETLPFPPIFRFPKSPSSHPSYLIILWGEAQACPWNLLPDAATVHKCQLMIALFFSNHYPHFTDNDLEIVCVCLLGEGGGGLLWGVEESPSRPQAQETIGPWGTN